MAKRVAYKYTEEYLDDLADKLDEWIKVEKNFWLGTFAAEQGFNRHRLSEFAVDHDKFKAIFEKAKQIQENKLMMLGLSNKGNCAMAIFALKNVAGWRDQKAEQEDGELKNQDLVFTGLPNGDGKDKFKRYYN